MGFLLKTFVGIKGKMLWHSLNKAAQNPFKIQQDYLLRLVKTNANTEYGRKFSFSKIRSEDDYQRYVPVCEYKDLEPYIEKIIDRRSNVLTADMPFMFNITSGTTDKPKYIPVTKKAQKNVAAVAAYWLSKALVDHPHLLDHLNFSITSAAVEGTTAKGIPYGSASGMIRKSTEWMCPGLFSVPSIVNEIKDYDLRYYIMVRLALEKDVSFVITPNPVTLIRSAEVAIRYQDDIIRAIRDGHLIGKETFSHEKENKRIMDKLGLSLKPNPQRAAGLENIVKEHGKLIPCHYWPNLTLIGCWLGGSVGVHAERLSEYYGEKAVRRDIGYLASEGEFNIPFRDNTPSGILAIKNNYYEFIHESEIENPSPNVLKSHELEKKEKYKIIITTDSGLYRYDIGDIIRVEDFYHQTPVITFIRKSSDMLNIVGEKLHVNHFLEIFKRIKSQTGLATRQFRVVPDHANIRYEIYLALDQSITVDALKNQFFHLVDQYLSEVNVEYRSKRESKRLSAPCFHLMDSSWEESVRRAFVLSGRRDVQFKWKAMSPERLELDERHIKQTILPDAAA